MGAVSHTAKEPAFMMWGMRMTILCLTVLLFVPPLDASEPTPGNFKQRVALVERILSKSGTAARANDQAKALLKQAEEKLNAAKASSDPEKANKLLGEAILLSTQASRATGPDLTWLHKEQFDNLLENLDGLKKTFVRNAQRLQPGSPPPPLPGVEEKMAKAKAAGQAKDYKQGVQLLKDAQKSLSGEMKTLLGKTLVYELKFDSPKDEYEYELGRLDGLATLMQMTLADTALDPTQEKLISKYQDQSRDLEKSGRNLAEKKDFPGAIKSLEQANEALLRALRAMGLPM